jgi:hypothetical protein
LTKLFRQFSTHTASLVAFGLHESAKIIPTSAVDNQSHTVFLPVCPLDDLENDIASNAGTGSLQALIKPIWHEELLSQRQNMILHCDLKN